MPNIRNKRIIKVLITSPSDVQEERAIAKAVIFEWNERHSDIKGVVLAPIMFEDFPFGFKTKNNVSIQEHINQRIVDKCDFAIGILSTKIGASTIAVPGGIVEEIDLMLEAGKPVMLYVSDIPVSSDAIDHSQITKLDQFLKKESTKSLISSFSNREEFRIKLARDLDLQIQSLINEFNSVTIDPLEQDYENFYMHLSKDVYDTLIKLLTPNEELYNASHLVRPNIFLTSNNPLELIVNPGSASTEELGELLFEISQLYRMIGGSGIVFRPSEIEIKQGEALS